MVFIFIILSRVADSLYWMSRYIERAENPARIVDVNRQRLLDYQRLDNHKLKEYWEPIIRSLGDDEIFYTLSVAFPCGLRPVTVMVRYG